MTIPRDLVQLTAGGDDKTRLADLCLPEMLTASDVASHLKISRKCVYAMAAAGRLPYVRIGSNIRFVTRQILEWIEEHNFRPRPSRDKICGRKAA